MLMKVSNRDQRQRDYVSVIRLGFGSIGITGVVAGRIAG
jgi:hypothetical protein